MRLVAALIISALAILSLSIPSIAEDKFTANKLLKSCAQASTRTACTAFIIAFSDGITFEKIAPGRICIPKDGAKASQIQQAIEKAVQDVPGFGDQDAEVVMFTALAEAFPCQK